MKKKLIPLIILTIWLLTINCSMPVMQNTPAPTSTERSVLQADQTDTASPGVKLETVSITPEPATQTAQPSATECTPGLVVDSDVFVRSGPGTAYSILGALSKDTYVPVVGKNNAGDWWYIEFIGGFGWVSASYTTTDCIPVDLAIVAAPPTPTLTATSLPPNGTCKDGYSYRKASPTDNVCVLPISVAQAQADNIAAVSRKLISIYGPDACAIGFVWRAAYPDDRVCVTPEHRNQATADNAAAASRWVSGAFGPHTCISGYVWREAKPGDDVCVTIPVADETAADNSVASTRTALAVEGPDACIAGYTWRLAFPGDHVCVTPVVAVQTAAENSDAPNHTW